MSGECIFEPSTNSIIDVLSVRGGQTVTYWGGVPVNEKLTKLKKEGREVEVIDFIVASKIRDDSFVTKFTEIDKEHYDEMLNVLPPMRWDRDIFAISEMFSGSITDFYFVRNNRYFTKRDSIYKSNDQLRDELTECYDLI